MLHGSAGCDASVNHFPVSIDLARSVQAAGTYCHKRESWAHTFSFNNVHTFQKSVIGWNEKNRLIQSESVYFSPTKKICYFLEKPGNGTCGSPFARDKKTTAGCIRKLFAARNVYFGSCILEVNPTVNYVTDYCFDSPAVSCFSFAQSFDHQSQGNHPGRAASWECTDMPKHSDRWRGDCTRLRFLFSFFLFFFFFQFSFRSRFDFWRIKHVFRQNNMTTNNRFQSQFDSARRPIHCARQQLTGDHYLVCID